MTDVPNANPPTVDAIDEHRHDPDPEALWNESWYFDFADPQSDFGAYLRFGLYPNLDQTWFQLTIAGADRPLVTLQDETAPLAGGDGMHLDTGTWSCTITVEEPLERMHVVAAGTAGAFGDPTAIYRDEPGEPVDFEIDLMWRSVAPPYHYGITTRYEVSSQVTGTITVDGEIIAIDAPGQRDHSWAVRDWWALDWCWSSGALDDGTAFHLSDIRVPNSSVGFGYHVPRGGELQPASSITATEVLDADGFATSAAMSIDDMLALEVEPIAVSPLVFTSTDGRVTHFPRLLCRFRAADGRSGTGWTEWNQVVGGQS